MLKEASGRNLVQPLAQSRANFSLFVFASCLISTDAQCVKTLDKDIPYA